MIADPREEEDGMFCCNCGEEIPDEARFCTSCGARVEDASPSDQAGEVPTTPLPADWAEEVPAAPLPLDAGMTQRLPDLSPSPPMASADAAYGADASASRASKARPRIVLVALGSLAVALALVVGLHVVPRLFGGPSGAGAGNEGTVEAGDTAKEQANLAVSQVDNSAFPKVTVYARFTNSSGDTLTGILASSLKVTEIGADGNVHDATVEEVAQMAAGDDMSVSLVLDQSGSMNSSGKMGQAQAAANAFIDRLATNAGTQAEITSFDSYVYNRQPFTDKIDLLKSAVSSLYPTGQTALNDALYWALQRTNLQSGSRVVIAFTDGIENASHYSQSDVTELARLTGIPVYIIGIGSDVDRSDLQTLATSCNGSYFDASTSGLASTLEGIYNSIYADQRSLYRVVFTSSYDSDAEMYRTLRLSCSDAGSYTGSCETTYMPVDNVPEFTNAVSSEDYVLADSSSRYYSREELERLSLWELYLARNEIFARYGRGFKNKDLAEYFATRRWYSQRYTAEQFEAMPSPLNDFELRNAELMLAIEKERNSPYLVTAK